MIGAVFVVVGRYVKVGDQQEFQFEVVIKVVVSTCFPESC